MSLLQKKRGSIEKIINTVGRRWSLMILLELGSHSPLRNQELRKLLNGISPSTLSEILKKLHKEKLIERKVYGTIPPLRVEYSLTKSGRQFLDALEPILEWSTHSDYS